MSQKCDINGVLVSRKDTFSVLSLHPHAADEKWWTTFLGPLWDVQRWALLAFELWVMVKMTGWSDMSPDLWGQCSKETCLLCLSPCLFNHFFHKMGVFMLIFFFFLYSSSLFKMQKNMYRISEMCICLNIISRNAHAKLRFIIDTCKHSLALQIHGWAKILWPVTGEAKLSDHFLTWPHITVCVN